MIIKNIEEQPLFQRKRIELISGGKTPSMQEARKEIATQLNIEEDLIIIKKIHQEYGMQKLKIGAFVYENAEAISKFERKKKEKKQEEKVEKVEKKQQEEKHGGKLEEKKEEIKEGK